MEQNVAPRKPLMAISFFNKDGSVRRTVNLYNTVLYNLAVGQIISFDHPTLSQCFHGEISSIGHVVHLSKDPPITYVDVNIIE